MVRQRSLFGSGAGLMPVRFYPEFDAWRREARLLLRHGRPPNSVWWQADPTVDPPSSPTATDATGEDGPTVPAGFIDQAKLASHHRSDDRWTLLYRLLWRLAQEDRDLLVRAGDPEVARLHRYAKAVRRDMHKMKAFVRFRITDDERYVAWFEPEHLIVGPTAGFFQRRFTAMRWSILTPDRCAHWEGAGEVWFSDGVDRSAAPRGDAFENLWRRYYRSVFNPARLKVDAMRAEMPQKYWKNLPEAHDIAQLIRGADARVAGMLEQSSAGDVLHCGPRPDSPATLLARARHAEPADSLTALRLAAADCRQCPLWEPATRTVFGEGPENAHLMLIGEQPGDQEDLAGRPFVGPAGQVLDRALDAAGIVRSDVYLTNAVKHFHFRPVGKRRLHERPREGHIHACRQWLDAEIASVDPKVIVCLGATAASARLGIPGRLQDQRGRVIDINERRHVVTVHPSYLLRLQDRAAARAEFQRFVDDLRLAATVLAAD